MDVNTLRYKIGIGLIPNIGPVIAKRLISYCGSIEAVFCEKPSNLSKIPGIGKKLVDSIVQYRKSEIPDKEIEYINKNHIKALFYLDDEYPERLRRCEDAPVIIYVKGDVDLDPSRIISIVGTRNPTDYGRHFTRELIQEMASFYPDIVIVSGLAYGIDIAAHKAALKTGLTTVAVLGHGLDFVYPSLHREVAGQIANKGALVSEFLHEVKPEAPNFIKRNRIIAGLADATVVVESGKKGGALITADMAESYHRDVFAVPGRVKDKHSEGCNNLIKSNRAAMVEDIQDIEYLMGWQRPENRLNDIQKQLFLVLSHDEETLMDVLHEKGNMTIDQLATGCKMPVSKASVALLSLECKGLIKCLPGKFFTALN